MSTDNSIQLPPRVKDETGNVYGKLTVLGYAGKTKSGDSQWLCQCECGKRTTAASGDIRKEYGGTKSCGCHRANAKGMCKSTEYTSWKEMKRRCYNADYPDYHLYGGKGITVCQRWLDAFINFFEDMGPKPFTEATIDRKDSNGNYEKDNCRWASKMEQSQNTIRARMLTYNGESYCLREWARKLGVAHRTIARRLDEQGWTMEQVVKHYAP